MFMQLRGYLAITVLLGTISFAPSTAWTLTATEAQKNLAGGDTFGVSVAASGDTAVIAADPSPETQLSAHAQIPFQEYRALPHRFRYRAFAVELESGEWGQSSQVLPPRIAIELAIADCRQRSASDCQVYAIGDIIVLGLAGWQTDVAVRLYQVKPDATNDDLEAVTSWNGNADVVALRRSVLFTAATMGSTDAIAAMLDRGIDIDASSDVGATALSYAASRGKRAAVALLIERGADVNARNGVNLTPLSVAMLATNFARPRDYLAADHDAVVRLLVEAGAIE